jgi:hypothetical protein
MALYGAESAAKGLGTLIGIWLMTGGTAAVSVGLRAAYAHVMVATALMRDVQEAAELLFAMGYEPNGRAQLDEEGDVLVFPYHLT